MGACGVNKSFGVKATKHTHHPSEGVKASYCLVDRLVWWLLLGLAPVGKTRYVAVGDRVITSPELNPGFGQKVHPTDSWGSRAP